MAELQNSNLPSLWWWVFIVYHLPILFHHHSHSHIIAYAHARTDASRTADSSQHNTWSSPDKDTLYAKLLDLRQWWRFLIIIILHWLHRIAEITLWIRRGCARKFSSDNTMWIQECEWMRNLNGICWSDYGLFIISSSTQPMNCIWYVICIVLRRCVVCRDGYTFILSIRTSVPAPQPKHASTHACDTYTTF